ncbi:MAG: peptidase U32 family protein [Candidatus Xenobia bacterium]
MRKPEVLAPAGDEASLLAALNAGADAVYFGLDEGFNARARAENFTLERLPETVGRIHRAGARAYLTLNTLIFEPELPAVERILRAVIRAGVDALIVQDPAVALLARSRHTGMELHASTQMTISSPQGARFAETLGVTRVVVPRELSVKEIQQLAEGTDLELEVFIVGALCVSWSGQCLSSEAWGGRSANRGQCAQACRLPYDLIVDGEQKPLGDVRYLLSPKDLAGFRAVAGLMEAGVHTLKVEGRQKGPVYVHAAVDTTRRWVDAVASGTADEQQLSIAMRDLSLAYSRGFGDGFLAGSDHQSLVEGRFPRHRGICLGEVADVSGDTVRVRPLGENVSQAVGQVSSPLPALGGSTAAASGPAVAPLTPEKGMGVVFDEGHPEEAEQGGPIFEVVRKGREWLLRFGTPGPDLKRVGRGARVWITSDPNVMAKGRRATQKEPAGGNALHVTVSGREGEPLVLEARDHRIVSSSMLTPARGNGLPLAEKLGELGGTQFRLESVDTSRLAPGLFLPVSELKRMRRELVDALSKPAPPRSLPEESQLPRLLAAARERYRAGSEVPSQVQLVPLCRTAEQLEAVMEAGIPEVVLDWMDLVGLQHAVTRAREAGLQVGIATVRIQKPGEEAYDARIDRLQPDSLLVRHWAGVMHFQGKATRPRVHGDFSLNVTNALTAWHLLELGLDSLTAAHDLDEQQLLALLADVPAERMGITVHHHIPTFHTEHCVYSNQLSHGRDYRTCGRPCEKHRIALRDRVGQEHPVIVDVGCRNTVFNAAAQSAASLAPKLVAAGARLFRIEFVWETREQARAVLEAWQALLQNRITASELLARVGAHEQFGVTRGTMQVLTK